MQSYQKYLKMTIKSLIPRIHRNNDKINRSDPAVHRSRRTNKWRDPMGLIAIMGIILIGLTGVNAAKELGRRCKCNLIFLRVIPCCYNLTFGCSE